MYNFPCTPDCPLEIYADWLEDQGIDPTEVRLMAMGWSTFGETTPGILVTDDCCGNGEGCYFSNGVFYGYGLDSCYGDGYRNFQGHSLGCF